MPNSLSPSINSTTLTCHSESSRALTNCNMRLPSMEELLKKTDRLSERNRTFGHFNPSPADVEMPTQGFVDLTSDSVTSSLSLPSFHDFSNPAFSLSPFSESPYTSSFDMPLRLPRRSRDLTATGDRPTKRRRGDAFDEFLNSRPSSSHSTNHKPAYKTKSAEVQDPAISHKEGIDEDFSRSNYKWRFDEDLRRRPQEDVEPAEQPNEQDKQLAETIKAQAGHSQGAPRLNQLTCIICMDDMVDMTATICGHLFCHKCITDALVAGEYQGDGRTAAKCPMCRTKLRRKVANGKPDIVPLSLKLMRRSDKSKGKQKEVLQSG